jgi:hypothetical protein
VVDRTTTAEEELTQGYGVNETSKYGATKTTQTQEEPTPVAVTNGTDDEGFFVSQFITKGKIKC